MDFERLLESGSDFLLFICLPAGYSPVPRTARIWYRGHATRPKIQLDVTPDSNLIVVVGLGRTLRSSSAVGQD